jgi:hypothetical protein
MIRDTPKGKRYMGYDTTKGFISPQRARIFFTTMGIESTEVHREEFSPRSHEEHEGPRRKIHPEPRHCVESRNLNAKHQSAFV